MADLDRIAVLAWEICGLAEEIETEAAEPFNLELDHRSIEIIIDNTREYYMKMRDREPTSSELASDLILALR